MLLLILGLVLWIMAHFFKRLANEQRASLGKGGKVVIAFIILIGLYDHQMDVGKSCRLLSLRKEPHSVLIRRPP